MADMTSVNSALKIITPYKELQTAWYEKQKFLKWLPTRKDFYGRSMEVPLGYGPGGGNSYGFAEAQRQSNNGRKYLHFTITRASNYTILYLENEAIEASEGGDGAYLETYKAELEGGNITNAQNLAMDLHGTGDGTIDTIATITNPGAGATITLSDPEKIVRFEIGQQWQAVASGASTPRAGTPGYMTITAVDEDNGTFDVDSSSGITGLTTTDTLVPAGNYDSAIVGVRGYVPFTDAELAAAGTLWGVDRTVHPTRLAGRRYDGSGYTLAGALEMGLSRFARGQCYPNALWVNDRYFTAVSMELGAKAVREFVKFGQFGFNTISINANGRTVPLMADQNIPDGYCEALTRESWVWHTLKEAPRYLTPTGSKMIVKPADDGVETRWGWRGQLVCRKPSDNGIIAMPTLS